MRNRDEARSRPLVVANCAVSVVRDSQGEPISSGGFHQNAPFPRYLWIGRQGEFGTYPPYYLS